jgi:hypothetical protein
MRPNARLIGIILLVLVISYGLVKAFPLIRGPEIVVSELSTSPEGLTVLSGTAVHTEKLTMNGGTLLIDGTGRFQTTLTLPRGGAILRLTATDRFGRSRTLEQVVVTP